MRSVGAYEAKTHLPRLLDEVAAGETITLTHTARDRSGFARGALEAARWVHGRQGWFTMRDVMGI